MGGQASLARNRGDASSYVNPTLVDPALARRFTI